MYPKIYHRGYPVTWGEHLQLHAAEDLQDSIKAEAGAIRESLLGQEHSLIVSTDTLSRGLDTGFSSTASALSEVSGNIEDLHSDFNYGMGLLLSQMELFDAGFKTIIRKLDEIHETLKHPLLTKAAELREIGIDRYHQGLLDKALEAFLESETLYDTDFIVELQIGILYLYGKNDDVDLINLSKATRHLRNAARYAKAEKSRLAGAAQKASQAYFYASIASYVNSNEEHRANHPENANKLLKEALDSVDEAVSLSPTFDQGYYHKAKCAALLGNPNLTVDSLEKAIIADKRYSVKVYADPDFDQVRSHVDDLIGRLRDRSRNQCQLRLQKLRVVVNDMTNWHLPDEPIEAVWNAISRVEKLLSTNAHLECQQALEILSDHVLEQFRDKLKLHQNMIEEKQIDLLTRATGAIKGIQHEGLERFLSHDECGEHKSTVHRFKKAIHDYDSLTRSITTLQKEAAWLENELLGARQLKRESEIRRDKRKKERIAAFRDISYVAGFIVPLIGIVLVIGNFNKIEQSVTGLGSGLLALYLGSAAVLAGMFIALIIKGSVQQEAWANFPKMVGLCAACPIVYIAFLLAVALVLLIPALIGVIFVGSTKIIDNILDWAVKGGYVGMMVVEWMICLKWFKEE